MPRERDQDVRGRTSIRRAEGKDPAPDLVAEAIWYSRLGWSVFPTARDKRPHDGFRWRRCQTERLTEQEIRELFAKPRVEGIAVVLGPVSGDLYCRDFDREDSYFRWARDHERLACSLPTVRTGRPGFHVYGRAKGVGFCRLDDGEFRAGSGHYSVIPRSLHPSGRRYEWVVPIRESVPYNDPIEAQLASATVTEAIQVAGSVTGTRDGSVTLPARTGSVTVPVRFRFSGPRTIEGLIRATLPSAAGEREACLLRLARGMKYDILDAPDDPKRHLTVIHEWHRLAVATISTKPFEATWAAYLRAYERARIPLNDYPPLGAFNRAQRLPTPARLQEMGLSPSCCLLAVTCRELHRMAGGESFPFSCAVGERLFGVDRRQINRWLNQLCILSVLTRVWKGIPDRAGGRASRYAWRLGFED